MRRKDVVLAPPPPSFMAVQQNTLPQQELLTSNDHGAPSSDSDSMSPSIIITFLVIATAVIVSATIFLLLRCISIYRRRSSSSSGQLDTSSDAFYHRQVSGGRVAPENNSLIESLPLFTFASIIGSKAAGGESGADCAVCLSKFEPEDKLRLLPVCCHVFHAECIDAWLATNQTCPLCRSSIFVSESELMSKISSTASAPNSGSRSGSFRIEIGSVSRRRPSTDFAAADRRRSYSIGSFDYIVDDVVSEVTVAGGGDKSRMQPEIFVPAPPAGEALAAEVATGGRGSWLKDYVDRMTWTAPFSLSSSLRSSGRFFTGSSRRTEESRAPHESDLEASRLGDEIGETFRWLSGM